MSSKKRPATTTLDSKIFALICELLDEKTANDKKGISDPEASAAHFASAYQITLSQAIDYIQLKDQKLKRTKRNLLEKSVTAQLQALRAEEDEEMGKPEHHDSPNSDSDYDESRLMEVKDSNSLNKSVVSTWNLKKVSELNHDQSEPPESVEQQRNENIIEDKKESKKRSKDTNRQVAKKHKSKIDHTTPSLTLSSLGGLDSTTTQLMELIGLPILHPEIYTATGVEPPRGVLLYGPPGCGKTTIANALAGELQVPFISISAPSVVSGMSGESEKKLREIFEEAKSLAPCIIFMDEIDAITPKRDGGAQREMERRIVAQLLTLMDELTLEKTSGNPVIVIGATNRPDSLDAALRRAGRFDREICLNVPNEEQRSSILRKMTKNIKMENDDDFNFRELAKLTPGYVGADLKSLVTAAGIAAIKRIFESLSEQEEDLLIREALLSNQDSMEIDSTTLIPNNESLAKFEGKSDLDKLSTIQRFLIKHPNPLSSEQLSHLAIRYSDFLTALPTVQPTAKREGFATVPDVTWQSVGALHNIRMELHMCVVQPIKKPELFLKVGISSPAGVLMWGPPGCGKTLLAKAVANESRANFISIKGPELLNKYVGESERAIRQVFQRARASIPCIIFFDELDALVPRRDASLSESSSRVVNTLLTELDGLNDRKGVFVIGATNRPDMIDPAMLRPGRLDKTLYIQLPSSDERFDILKTLVIANKTPLAEDVNLREVAHNNKCRNFSGADLSSLVREAGVLALKKKFFKNQKIDQLDASGFYENDIVDDNIKVTMEDFNRALQCVNPSVSDRDRLKYEKLNKRMGWSMLGDQEKEDEPPQSNVA
ncbi:AAA ATPase [Scheffersomyces xylosifermentans]|uniref:AAA ATPase n=1 Tax=Scheffersomyces xylosifermentans TaxID=1304137 RepID=UPI00315CF402